MRSVGLIVNPKHAYTYRAYADLVAGLDEHGLRYRTMSTTTARSGRWQAEQLLNWGADAVIILGGDGTIRACAPVLAAAGMLTFLVPTGTANVLSRHIGIASAGQAIDHCIKSLQPGSDSRPAPDSATGHVSPQVRHVPVNIAEIRDAQGRWARHDFLSLAGVGGDARAVAHHRRAPGLLGYAWGAAGALFAADLRTVVRSEDTHRPETGRIWSLMASKAVRPAGPISVFPAARIDGREFSVLTVGPLPAGTTRRLRAWGSIAVACLRGRPADHPCLNFRRSASARIELTTPGPAQLDGDLIGDCLELRVRAGESRLSVSASPT